MSFLIRQFVTHSPQWQSLIDCVANLEIVENVDGKIFKHSLPMASSGKHIIKAKCKFNCIMW